MTGFLILPGLINAHDHLEFNLMPRLGCGPYADWQEWAKDIYRPAVSPLREHVSVPRSLRLLWGGVKNLLSGITTVCHHNPYEQCVFDADFPVKVVSRYGWAHSLALARDLWRAYVSTPPDAPFIIHLGEGTNARSRNEIYALDHLGALDSRTVIVHGVGLTPDGHKLRRQRRAALIWCPTSNRHTLGVTLDPRSFTSKEAVALGSDSALSAQGDMLDEIKAARREGAEPEAIYSMVTDKAAAILRLNEGEGKIRAGGVADFIAVRQGSSPAGTLLNLDLSKLELVMLAGKVQLISPRMARRCPRKSIDSLERVELAGVSCYVRVPMSWMMQETRKYLRQDFRLAGKAIKT